MKNLYLLAACLLVNACSSLNSTSLTSIPRDRSNQVRAEASRTIILGLNFDNDFVDQIRGDLKDQCPDGQVRGILTKDELVNYFLFIVIKRQVSATGYCVKGS